MGSDVEEFPTIDTTPMWSSLKMDEDLDDDSLLIELHCLIHSTSKLRFTRDTPIGDSQYTDETTAEGQEYIKKLLNYHKKTNVTKLRPSQDQLSSDRLTPEQKIIKDLFWIYTNIILNNLLDEVKLKNPEVVVVDPTNKLKSKADNFFKDGLHLTSAGNEVIAESILISIMESFDLKDFPS